MSECSWSLTAREGVKHQTSWRYLTRITSLGKVILQMFLVPLHTWHVEENCPRISIINHLMGQTVKRKFLSKASSVVEEDVGPVVYSISTSLEKTHC